MPRSEKANQMIREQRREHILNSSISVFARRGLGATKVADLAEASNISLGLLYHYFRNKEEVFVTLVEQGMSESLQALQTAKNHPGSPLEKLRLYLQHALVRLWERPEYALIIQHAFTSEATPEELRIYLTQRALEIQETLLHFITEGQEAGEIVSSDPAELTLLVLACIQGLTNSALYLAPSGVRHPNPDTILHMLHP